MFPPLIIYNIYLPHCSSCYSRPFCNHHLLLIKNQNAAIKKIVEFLDNSRVCLNWSSPAAMRSPRLDFGPAWRHGLCPCRWRTVSTLPMRQLGRWHSCCHRCTSSRCRQVWVEGDTKEVGGRHSYWIEFVLLALPTGLPRHRCGPRLFLTQAESQPEHTALAVLLGTDQSWHR